MRPWRAAEGAVADAKSRAAAAEAEGRAVAARTRTSAGPCYAFPFQPSLSRFTPVTS